jgi:hypothetical protein
VILNFSLRIVAAKGRLFCKFSLYKTYRVVSSAPVDVLWQKLINVADVSWHPLIAKADVPLGLIAKPGLIYQAVTRLTPIPDPGFRGKCPPRGTPQPQSSRYPRHGTENDLPSRINPLW